MYRNANSISCLTLKTNSFQSLFQSRPYLVHEQRLLRKRRSHSALFAYYEESGFELYFVSISSKMCIINCLTIQYQNLGMLIEMITRIEMLFYLNAYNGLSKILIHIPWNIQSLHFYSCATVTLNQTVNNSFY